MYIVYSFATRNMYAWCTRTQPPRKSPSGSTHRKLERVIKTGAGTWLCGACIYYRLYTHCKRLRERERERERSTERTGRKVFYFHFILFLCTAAAAAATIASCRALIPGRDECKHKNRSLPRKLHRLRPFQWRIETFKTFLSFCTRTYYIYVYTRPQKACGVPSAIAFESTQDSFIIGINSEMYAPACLYICIQYIRSRRQVLHAELLSAATPTLHPPSSGAPTLIRTARETR